jgi:hypothetical protein
MMLVQGRNIEGICMCIVFCKLEEITKIFPGKYFFYLAVFQVRGRAFIAHGGYMA